MFKKHFKTQLTFYLFKVKTPGYAQAMCVHCKWPPSNPLDINERLSKKESSGTLAPQTSPLLRR